MKEELIRKNLTMYEIPSTHHINNYVNSLLTSMRKEKKSGKGKEVDKKKRKTRHNMSVKYSQDMEELVQGYVNIGAFEIEKKLMSHLEITEDDVWKISQRRAG